MFDIHRNFKVEVQGRGAIQLGPQDYVTSGGEGHIYRKSGGRKGPSSAIKIWDDPSRAADARMPERIGVLSAIRDPRIVAPQALACDAGGTPLGYVMPWVEGKWELAQAFTNDWRTATGFTDAHALAFAERMCDVMQAVHAQGIVMGDASELNVLGTGAGAAAEPRYIDVDAWIPPGFQGDSTLPTILDHHSPRFSSQADWFAWAVTTFQLLTGVHPYRATHPAYGRQDFEARMKANASVFDPGVRLSAAVRSFDRIPPALLAYYRKTFQDGHRAPPPPFSGTQPAAVRAPQASAAKGGGVQVTKLYQAAGAVLSQAARDVLLLEGGSLVSMADGRGFGRADPGATFVRGPANSLAAATVEGGMVRFGILQGGPLSTAVMADTGIAASRCWAADNRLFAVVHDGILELERHDLARGPVALPGRKWTLGPNSTTFGEGVALYDALGARFLVVPFGGTGVALLRCRELDGLRPVAMLRRGRTASMALMDARGNYLRATLSFDEGCSRYAATVAPADDGSLNEAITDSGIVVRFAPGDELELAVPATGNVRRVALGGQPAGRLLAGPSGVFMVLDGTVCKLSVS